MAMVLKQFDGRTVIAPVRAYIALMGRVNIKCLRYRGCHLFVYANSGAAGARTQRLTK